jgi:hypothetical protein
LAIVSAKGKNRPTLNGRRRCTARSIGAVKVFPSRSALRTHPADKAASVALDEFRLAAVQGRRRDSAGSLAQAAYRGTRMPSTDAFLFLLQPNSNRPSPVPPKPGESVKSSPTRRSGPTSERAARAPTRRPPEGSCDFGGAKVSSVIALDFTTCGLNNDPAHRHSPAFAGVVATGMRSRP